jgi:two-component sensor histidine kinase
MKKIYFIILLLSGIAVSAQDNYQKSADSLQAIINEAVTDSSKVQPCIALCTIYKKYSLTKFIACNEQLLHILQKTKSSQDYGFYYNNMAQICNENNNNLQATIYAAKANVLFYKNKDWDNYILNGIEYAIYLSINDEMAKATAVLNKTLTIATKTKSKHIATVYYGFFCFYNGLSNYKIALTYAKKALALEKNIANKAKIYYLVGHMYNSLGNFKNALEYNELASKYSDIPHLSIKFKFHKAKILFNMQHYQEALTIAVYCNEYYKKNNYVAKYYDGVIFISDCYFKLKKYQLADAYIDEGLKSRSERRIMKIGFMCRKAKTCLALNDTKTGKKYIDQALSLVKEDDYFEQKIEIYNIKSKLEEVLGNYKTALFYTNKIASVKDVNTANFNKNKLHQLEVDLNVTEKNNRIKNLQITQLKKQVEINTKTDYIVYISIALFLALVSVLVYIKNYNTIKTKNLIIESEKLQVKKSLLEKETLLKEIHHRVKNNLQLVMSLLNIQAQKENQDVEGFLAVSKSRILSMALIHENLYQSENLNEVNFKEYIHNLTKIILNAYKTEHTLIILQIKMEEVYFDIQTAIPLGLIINELVNNAYKHAFVTKSSGCITIQLIPKGYHYELSISDNGIGIDQKNNAKKTLGLQLVEELVFQIDGKLKVENNNGMHYSVEFQTTKTV